jgi:hypothetical protein
MQGPGSRIGVAGEPWVVFLSHLGNSPASFSTKRFMLARNMSCIQKPALPVLSKVWDTGLEIDLVSSDAIPTSLAERSTDGRTGPWLRRLLNMPPAPLIAFI